jgi:hypothetical protein
MYMKNNMAASQDRLKQAQVLSKSYRDDLRFLKEKPKGVGLRNYVIQPRPLHTLEPKRKIERRAVPL